MIVALLQAAANAAPAVPVSLDTGLDNPVAIGGTAIAASIFIQWLKNSGWATWFTRESAKANLALSGALALALSFGIHFSSDATAYTIIISRHELWQALAQLVAQHTSYKTLVVPSETLGEIRGLLSRVLTPPPISEGDAKLKGTGS